MKPGVESQTAVMVCMGRAAAHGTTPVTRFQDPTAYALLPAEAQRRVEKFRMAYHSPALMLLLAALVLRGMGEPIRSAFTPERMRALLARHGLQVLHDEALPAIGATLSEDVGRSTRIMKHLRIATADVPVKRILA